MKRSWLTSLALLLTAISFLSTSAMGDINQGLVAHWDFNENTGSILHDVAPGATGTYNGAITGATWESQSAGGLGSCLYFDAETDRVEFSSPVLNNPPYTVCAWIKASSLGGPNRYVLSNGGQTATQYGMYMNWETSINKYCFGSYNSGGYGGDACYTAAVDQWVFLCGVWDGSTGTNKVKLYWNGELVSSGPTGHWNNGSADNLIFAHPSNYHTSYGWRGWIDEVRIYNRVLSGAEIQWLCENTSDWRPYDQRFAIVVMGGDVSGQSYEWYWGDTHGMYEELLSYGFTANNIYFLSYGSYADAHPEWVRAQSITANIQLAYQWAAANCTAADLLYIYWVDHGDPAFFVTHDGTMTHAQLATLMQPIFAKQIIGAYNPCFSGAVIDDISRPGVISITSQDATHTNSWGWAGMWRRALRSDPGDNVDADSDGYISMTEAYNWIAPQSQAAGEHSMFDDNWNGAGSQWGQAGYDPNTPGSDGYIGKFYSLQGWKPTVVASRGDADGSGLVDISDAVYLIGYIFAGGSTPFPLLAGDADCSLDVDISDAVFLISYIFAGGPAPCADR